MGGSGLEAGHFPVRLQLVTRSQRTTGLVGSLLPSAGRTGKVQPEGWGAVTPMHRQRFQGGRQGTGKRVQGWGRAWEDGGG